MKQDLTQGSITKRMLLFSLPMMIGNLLQQLYNVADTFIVGRYLGADALAAVGSAYTLMTFLTSVILGLCMGSGVVFAIRWGERNEDGLKNSIFVSFTMISVITLALNALVLRYIDPILRLLQVPAALYDMMRTYLLVIFLGIFFTFLYNYFATLLRSLGNSVTPLLFLGTAAVLNAGLDVYFIAGLGRGVRGAAEATVIAQGISAVGILLYAWFSGDLLRLSRRHLRWGRAAVGEVLQCSSLTSLQQSVMNFGILMIQGLVNSFGPAVMAAFAVAVKIDSFAYMPVHDFGNAFSVFTAQNYGAGRQDRIHRGMKSALITAFVFCCLISLLVCIFARSLMMIFIAPEETEILAIGVQYLRIEGAFYVGIGCLFLLYGYYRAVQRPGMSVVLTVISLGTRVVLAYTLAAVPAIGVRGIWWAIPIGWLLADAVGILYYLKINRHPASLPQT